MKVKLFLSEGADLTINDFDAGSALDMVEELAASQFHTFEMDDAAVIVNRDHIIRIDFD